MHGRIEVIANGLRAQVAVDTTLSCLLGSHLPPHAWNFIVAGVILKYPASVHL